jgi:hypothetical protein
MGWRETLTGTGSGSTVIDEIDKNDKTPLSVNSVNFVHAPETPKQEPPRNPEGLGLALAEAANGLPVTLDQLVEAFGAEGESDWLEGYEPHCRPEFLRAFAETVAARLEREQAAEPEPEPPAQNPQNRKPEPNPLEGLALLPEDWRLVERRTRGRRNRESLLTEYARRWKEAAEAEPLEHRKANAGRFAANAWLREARA